MNGQPTFDAKQAYNAEQLDQALYHAVDIAGRCMMRFMLWGETAKSIIDFGIPQGDGIYLGVRRADLPEFVVSTMRTLAKGADINYGIKDFEETDDHYSWTYHNVPITIKIVNKTYPFLNNPNFIWYRAEEYKIPNPFSAYWQTRNLVK